LNTSYSSFPSGFYTSSSFLLLKDASLAQPRELVFTLWGSLLPRKAPYFPLLSIRIRSSASVFKPLEQFLLSIRNVIKSLI
jgi:hypothetical protein